MALAEEGRRAQSADFDYKAKTMSFLAGRFRVVYDAGHLTVEDLTYATTAPNGLALVLRIDTGAGALAEVDVYMDTAARPVYHFSAGTTPSERLRGDVTLRVPAAALEPGLHRFIVVYQPELLLQGIGVLSGPQATEFSADLQLQQPYVASARLRGRDLVFGP